MKITTLIENDRLEGSLLQERFGLSLYIEVFNKKLLFDSGPDDAFIHNAEALGIDLREVDACILSHAHFDHSGGVRNFLELNSKAMVYALSAIQGKYYSRQPLGKFKPIGLDEDTMQRFKSRFCFFDRSFKLFDRIELFAVENNNTFLPSTNRLLFKDSGNGQVNDDFAHELVMAIPEKGTNTVFTGCAHSGILNMLLTVKGKMADFPVKTLIGGFHLVNPATKRIGEEEETVRQLARDLTCAGVEKIYTGHCTGKDGYGLLKEILEEKIELFYTGKVIDTD